MNKKSWMIFAIIVVAIVGGMIYISTQNRLNVSDINNDQLNTIIGAESRNGDIADHEIGSKSPKVTIIEYADYQCPGCSAAAPKAKALAEKYKDHVRLIFRNFPIASSHPNARAAAAVAEAAGLQGKFWEMNKLLYTNQDAWKNANITDRDNIFKSYAEQLKLNIDQYKTDIASNKVKNKIDFDMALGRKHGVAATPTFYVNGKNTEMDSSGSIESSVKEALKKAGVEVKD
ncbi:DsbA family protein [Candidatus Nanosynbacter sp. HMT-352]|jgi:Na+/H+ antiporter, nhaA family protein|uniref:DsbA family protein n=1 Tax=Candidatus Nanosynbacter sp. HMT-352 TaxID=2899133 RepID=UPI001E4BB45E|nr:thioredoxin domain-containing protein [Candidatus Nanosynbacter sp. HMT-352]UHA57270.1 DsbA family protein [Candidatus Nanosynbacter sp. HMT-352]